MKNEDIKLCAVVPVYRHEQTVKGVVESIVKYGLPVFIVDDGNTPEAKAVLENVASEIPEATLVSYSKNGGKGKAVSAGLEAAFKAGFTHALQVDADGQHSQDAIPFFIKAAKNHPESAICGYPEYDASVPKSRLQGRKITNFWVAVETISFDIPDAMCGFRVYPLKQAVPLLRKIGDFRMGFDIEILVRMHWKKIPMRFYPIKVNYPEGGISNFRMFRDNVAISLTHTRLCFGTAFRLPLLLCNKFRNHR